MSAVLAAIEPGGSFSEALSNIGELFNFEPIIPIEIGGLELGINRVVLMLLFATLVTIALFAIALSSPKLVPDRVQNAVEAIIEFIREQIAISVIGERGRRYVPYLTTLFMFVWINNLFEIIPLINFPPTSSIVVPGFLAIITWVVFLGLGFREQGVGGYLKELVYPPGAPKLVLPLLAPIEFVSNVILRPFTLTIRLFANMVAGHILLVIVFFAIHAFLLSVGPGLPVGIAALAISPIAVGFELFIATLQAFIFTILTAVYIAGAVEPEH
jgi:F-type H+-transporting ATPase subunit a